MAEPIHDRTIRSTATSKAEGRIKPGLSRKKKRKIVRKKLKNKTY